MYLTIEQYKKYKFDRLSDADILELHGYNRNNNWALIKWKKKNSVKGGKGASRFLDRDEVLQYLQNHSAKDTAKHFGISIRTFYRWEEKERMKYYVK